MLQYCVVTVSTDGIIPVATAVSDGHTAPSHDHGNTIPAATAVNMAHGVSCV